MAEQSKLGGTESRGSGGHTSSSPFAKPPSGGTLKLHPFQYHANQADLDRLMRKLNDVEDIPATYENSFAPEDMELGVRKGWMEEMLQTWKGGYDWRKTEEEFNSFPHYTTPLSTKGHNYTVHFMALFSQKKDAVPIVMTHGWPGSFLEFIPIFKLLTSTYTPQTLPVHLICPSLIGFGFSSPPPRHDRFNNLDVADLWDQLMRGLGFSSYVAQGGDIGSFVTQLLAQKFDACKAIHVNMLRVPLDYNNIDKSNLSAYDRDCADRLQEFIATEFAYRNEHATKPGTIGIVVGSCPVALLAWIGEKYIRWSDTTPTPTQILDDITLYYLTRTFATSLTHYWAAPPSRYALPETQPDLPAIKKTGKPVGYSLFKKEITPFLPEWAEGHVNLVWSAKHDKGGHFAALEQPELLWEDLQAFLKVAWTAKSQL